MRRYYLKPIFWNTNGYQKPSGVQATSGYPLDEGYGHEEWNSAPFLKFKEQGNWFRAFHTEGLGNAPVADADGQIFIFLYASHGGVQQLVGAMGKATCLALDERRPERESLVRRLGIEPLWRDAWQLKNVKECYDGKLEPFMRSWNRDVHWIPNWKCPEQLFFWPEQAITLDPKRITGKKRLLNMFGRYTAIGPGTASRVMASVPSKARTDAWSRIVHELDASFDDADADIVDIKGATNVGETTKEALIDARLGQGSFRIQLMTRWDSACAVTGCNQSQVLRASHIKPWRSSSNAERLNPRNGLLLSANIDALFDRGLVSFRTNGEMLVSEQVTEKARKLLGLPGRLRHRPNAEEVVFLDYHRKTVFSP